MALTGTARFSLEGLLFLSRIVLAELNDCDRVPKEYGVKTQNWHIITSARFSWSKQIIRPSKIPRIDK
jgi:hypothetical protein